MEINKLPLYDLGYSQKDIVFYTDSHAGLIFEKFFDAYDGEFMHTKQDVLMQNRSYSQQFFDGFLCKTDILYYKIYVDCLVNDYISSLKHLLSLYDKEKKRIRLDRICDDISALYKHAKTYLILLKFFKKTLSANQIPYDPKNEKFLQRLDQSKGEQNIRNTIREIYYTRKPIHTNNKEVFNIKLKKFINQQISLVRSQSGDGKIYKLDWHMVTGMGNSHPVENGFTWHPTLGVPYIPGSQVKGIVRSLIEQYFDNEGNKEKGINKNKILQEWFGSDDKKSAKQNQVGRFIFFDAIPVEKPTLVLDIMTPHMGKWYAEGDKIKNINTDGNKIPADWHDPIPIPFLAIKEASFLFTIADRKPDKELKTQIEDVFKMLNIALKRLGAGAKTQTGYGYMSEDKDQTDSIKEMTENEIIVNEVKKLLKDTKDINSQNGRILELLKIATNDKNKWGKKSRQKLLEIIDDEDICGFLPKKRPKKNQAREKYKIKEGLVKTLRELVRNA